MAEFEEIMKSLDPDKVKSSRGGYKSHVVMALNTLESSLTLPDTTEGYDHKDPKINKFKIKSWVAKLNQAFERFEKVHDRFVYIRREPVDNTEEKKFQDEDLDYFHTVADRVFTAQAANAAFLESLKEFEVIENEQKRQKAEKINLTNSIPDKTSAYETTRLRYENSKTAVLKITSETNSLSVDQLQEMKHILVTFRTEDREEIDSLYKDLNLKVKNLKHALGI